MGSKMVPLCAASVAVEDEKSTFYTCAEYPSPDHTGNPLGMSMLETDELAGPEGSRFV